LVSYFPGGQSRLSPYFVFPYFVFNLGHPDEISNAFVGFQKYLYEQITGINSDLFQFRKVSFSRWTWEHVKQSLFAQKDLLAIRSLVFLTSLTLI
jgi:hypothetical protein